MMKVFRFSKKAVCLFVSIVYVLSTPVSIEAVSSFGITPPYVIGSDLEPGSVHTQKIYIVRRDASNDLTAEISWNVPGADGWLSIDRGESFTIPEGMKRFPIIVEVRVPEVVSAGKYEGSLEVEVMSSDEVSSSGMISVGLRTRAIVRLSVLKDGVDEQLPDQVAGVFFAGYTQGLFWLSIIILLLMTSIYFSRKKFKCLKG